MFVRKKPNKSGSISIQIIDKSEGKYKVVKTLGSSSDPEGIQRLWRKAHNIISELCKQATFNLISEKDRTVLDFLKDTEALKIHVIGPELIFGKLFDLIGFNKIKDELFRYLVIARLAYPCSKLKTIDYLQRYRGIKVNISKIYRFLDRLKNTHKEIIESIAFNHTKSILRGEITVVFCDMTTLYFEAEDEDDLRKIGFNKDGKFQKPQIILGLLVGLKGYPIAYDIFKGNTFEGHTLIPMLEKFQERFNLSRPIVVADAALLSKDNLSKLREQGYKYIIGRRIKSESDSIKAEILKRAKGMRNGDSFVIKKPRSTRLIVTYSDKRKKKDAHNRERGLNKLRKRVKSGKLTKQTINNRGYNKFLTLTGKINITIDENKIKEDKKWDGLKGYITNTRLSPKNVVENYKHLWEIEKAFRISKTDLKVRPVYHRRQSRIEAHICIAFVAYTIYKELERILYKHKAPFSVKRASELTQTIYELEYTLPESRNHGKILFNTLNEQKTLCNIVDKYRFRVS